MNEDNGNVTFTVGVRGGTNSCNKTEWTFNYVIQNVSALCKQSHQIYAYSINNLTTLNAVLEDYTAADLEGVIYVNTSQPASVTVKIMDDSVLEPDETFQIKISLLGSDRNCVILQPSVIDITIIDNDSELIYA